tara:strand:- start:400 stop:540 length:141 start_codon:yes stop_codon:yes gene_type:complete
MVPVVEILRLPKMQLLKLGSMPIEIVGRGSVNLDAFGLLELMQLAD